MSGRGSPRRQPHRFEVRLKAVLHNGSAVNEVKTRSSKLSVAMLAVMEILRLWAASDGAVRVGTVVSLVDTTDGAEVMSLRWFGFDANTLDGAVQTFRAGGFTLKEVAQHGQE